MNLEQLDLSSNLLNSSIMKVLSGLSNLKSLNIGNNQLKGSINIKELENASTNVQEIFLSPYLEDNFLQSIGALTSLGKLTLSNSSMTGPLTAEGWCDLWNLEELNLGGNALEGSIHFHHV